MAPVTMTLPDGEPPAGPWDAVGLPALVERVIGLAGRPSGRPPVVGVDGRSASGKSTLASRIAGAVAGSAVVHTDDVAWNEPFFAWGRLLRDGILTPVHRGEDVRFRPPAWSRHGRPGRIDVPAGVRLVVVEGVGAGQQEVDDLVDVLLWVQSDLAEAERRGIARDLATGVNGTAEETVAFWHEWMGHETAFLRGDRPWERADLVVAGTAVMRLGDDEVAVAPGPIRRE